MFATPGLCWVHKVYSSFLPSSLPPFLPFFILGLVATKSGSFSTQRLYSFSHLKAVVFSFNKREGQRGRTTITLGRRLSLGQPPTNPSFSLFC